MENRLMVVLEESVEVANAMAKLHTSELAIGELRKKQNSSKSNATAEETDNTESPTHAEIDVRENEEVENIPVQAPVIHSEEKEVFDTQADHTESNE